MQGDTPEVQERVFKCEGCGAALRYAPGTAAMKCEYCGREQRIPTEGAATIREHDFSELEMVPSTSERGFGLPARHFRCDMCSAVTTIPGEVTATRCAFCGSDVVVEAPAVEGMVMPESLIPFMVTRDDAVLRFQEWLKGLWFRPGDLKKKAALADIDGLYAPHFTFDANAFSTWSGEAGFYYYVSETYTDAQGNLRTRRVRRIRWEYRSGTHSAFYDDVLVCASRGLPHDIMGRIYPYDLSALVPYSPGFLSGFRAESYTVEPRTCWLTARERMYREEVAACSRLLDGDTQRGLVVDSRFEDIRWKHLLLPVYVAAYAYGKRTYRFMVNGQTGEVQGESPISWVKVGITAAVVALVIFLLLSRYMGWI